MHEMSIALEVCDIVERALGDPPRPPASVVGVVLDVGDDAGVEVGSLTFCLDALLTSPPFRNGSAVVRRQRGDALRVAYIEVDECP